MKKKNKKILKVACLAIAIVLVISACSPSEINHQDQETPMPVDLDPTTTSSSGLDCLDEGYPCTYSEVDPQVLEASFDALDQAALTLDETGDIEAAVSSLEERSDLADLIYSLEGIRFRLENSPPMWLINGAAIASGTKSPGGNSRNADTLSKIQFRPSQVNSQQDDGPIGESNRGEEPIKKALLLSPFWWEFGGDETQELTTYLSQIHRNYNCDDCEVVLKINTVPERQSEQSRENYNLTKTMSIDYGVSILDFMNWNEFDLIHLSTHGTQICDDGRCEGFVMTGRFLENPKLNESGAPENDIVGLDWGRTAVPGCGVLDHRMETEELSDEEFDAAYEEWKNKGCGTFTNRYWQYAGPDFFKAQYTDLGKSLDDKLIYFSSCKTMRDLSMAEAVAGENTTVLGWTENVEADAAAHVALKFYDLYVGKGLRAKVAFDEVKDEIGEEYQIAAFRRFKPKGIEIESLLPPEFESIGDEDTRGREIITLMQPIYRSELKEKDAIPTLGIPGDNEVDEIMLLVQVDGIDESQDSGAFEIHIAVDGEELNETIKPQERVDDYSYWALGVLPLPFDSGERTQIKLETWIDLPQGGQSRHVLEEINLANCGWRASLSNSQSGEIKGDITFPTATISEATIEELSLLADKGYLGPKSDDSSLPSANELASLPESYMLGNQQELPFLGIIPGYGANAMLERNSLAIGDQASVNLTKDDGKALEGSFSTSLIDLTTQERFNADGEFVWHIDSLCSMDVILELGSNPYPESMVPTDLTP